MDSAYYILQSPEDDYCQLVSRQFMYVLPVLSVQLQFIISYTSIYICVGNIKLVIFVG